MADVFCSDALSLEDMPQMSSAILAEDLDAVPICVRFPTDGTVDFVIETRPAATGLELILRTIERCIALPAEIRSSGLIPQQFAGTGAFRSLVQDDSFFVRIEFVVP